MADAKTGQYWKQMPKKILDESKMKHSFNKDGLKRRRTSVTTQSCKSQDHPKLDLHLKNQSEWILIEFSFLQTVFFCRFSKAGENFHRKSFIPNNCPHPLLLRGKLKDDIIPFLCPENEKKFLI
ncbi:hypothetical protein [Allobaculum sp. JKK-2023]|uniref:hypothetical protein n=1 Tax=Allobaculum sp. JKK-2023 TaxID=3108943 RepID=UPI002B05CED9|nr:hypothetical protein [Allobaculum sp. JKK-2023]